MIGLVFHGLGHALRVGPVQMPPMPVQPGGGIAHLPTVGAPIAPPVHSGGVSGPPHLSLPHQILMPPTAPGAIPLRLPPSSITSPAMASGTTNGMTFNRPGALIPGPTGSPTNPINTITTPTTALPISGARPGGITTPITTQPVYQPPQPSTWERILGGTQIAVAPNPGGGIQVGAAVGGMQAMTTVGPGGRPMPAGPYMPTPMPGGLSPAAPNGSCIPYHSGLVGWFDGSIGAFLRTLAGQRQDCWGGGMAPQVGNPAMGQQTNTAMPYDSRLLNTPALPAPGSIQQGIPIQQQMTPSVFQR